ncbi:DUF805 domain-containing protein [Caulobacter sp.]|uniref:DUF805 domain-containing protein n=1 Tax=Caulobacter sp. TaxID=78 RepID=UPI001B1E741A|nr:DUF805 domain-containing protein [Caulobacter sp.]MBO9547782.1 DUF805 domain-containing protein [Caulobacter sp.]
MDFSGRDPRRVFWPYVGVVILLLMIVMGAGNMIAVSLLIPTTVEQDFPDLSGLILLMGVEIVAVVALLAAAVARRLHDTGRRAWWGLAPLPFLAFGFGGFYILVRNFETPFPGSEILLFAIFFNNLLYLAVLLALVVLLSQPSQAMVNRYGAAPEA